MNCPFCEDDRVDCERTDKNFQISPYSCFNCGAVQATDSAIKFGWYVGNIEPMDPQPEPTMTREAIAKDARFGQQKARLYKTPSGVWCWDSR